MMLHGSQAQSQSPSQDTLPRKRKAETQTNERLSKRFSLLNIERNGSKLYVPVEEPSASRPNPTQSSSADDNSMHIDDSKHKVYIYNIDDELSSEDDEAAAEGKLIFLPDIERHLKANRIPPQIFANDEGELAGMQVVLYSDPKSLSVPEGQDSVRKAIIEARQRAREKQSGHERPNIEGDSHAMESKMVGAVPLSDADGDESMDLD